LAGSIDVCAPVLARGVQGQQTLQYSYAMLWPVSGDRLGPCFGRLAQQSGPSDPVKRSVPGAILALDSGSEAAGEPARLQAHVADGVHLNSSAAFDFSNQLAVAVAGILK
jgi:hypothetical protein